MAKTLQDYPRPSVAVDAAVLTVPPDGPLSVLLVLAGADDWRLPGTFLHEGETLRDAVLRALKSKAGVEGLDPRQLHVFDDPTRDDRGWVLSVAHFDVVRADRLPASDAVRLVPISELPVMKYDHAAIVGAAAEALRSEYAEDPDPRGLLDRPFAMPDLRRVHEAIAGQRLQPDTFRRAMRAKLTPTGETVVLGRGRPAELYR